MGVHLEHRAWLMVLRVGHCVCVEAGTVDRGAVSPLLSPPRSSVICASCRQGGPSWQVTALAWYGWGSPQTPR